MNRRDFLWLTTAPALLPLGRGAWALTAGDAPKRLIVILLRGAVDGLNVVVPYAERAYYDARQTIAIPPPDVDGGALPLDSHFGLHPALLGLIPLWTDKKLSFVHAAGSTDPTRSHFDAQLFIENGTPGRKTTPDGWMNRLLAGLPAPHGPTDALSIGATLPQILKGKLPVANLPLGPQASRAMPLDRAEIGQAFDRLYARDDAISEAYREGRAARAELIGDLPSETHQADNGAPPPNSFPAEASRLAYLLLKDRRIRLAFASLGGWDTHVNQGSRTGQLARHLGLLGDGAAALAKGLGKDFDDTVIVVISEFGRTVHENGNGGTDHGHGNVIWVLGGRVRGGQVYGDWPGLAAKQLYQGRDLAVTTDFRLVLATILERHLGLRGEQLDRIFPGMPPGRSGIEQILAV
jgi:uncharacterized protein (DUF1501 family)